MLSDVLYLSCLSLVSSHSLSSLAFYRALFGVLSFDFDSGANSTHHNGDAFLVTVSAAPSGGSKLSYPLMLCVGNIVKSDTFWVLNGDRQREGEERTVVDSVDKDESEALKSERE